MPLSNKILDIDPKAYAIARKLDDRIDKYIKKKQSSHISELGLKEVLKDYSEILFIINGYENPPREIMQELTDEGIKALFDYYHRVKSEIIGKYFGNIILSYDSIRMGLKLLDILDNYEKKVVNIDPASKEISFFSQLYDQVIEERLENKNDLLHREDIPIEERKFLFNLFEKELNSKVITKILQAYLSKVIIEINAEIKQFFRNEAIVVQSVQLPIKKQIRISKKILSNFDHYKKISLSCFTDHFDDLLISLQQEQDKVFEEYKVLYLKEEQIEEIENYITSFEHDLSNKSADEDINLFGKKIKNNYRGPLKEQMFYFIDQEIEKNP